jgi:predicted metal-binding membrane protein
MAGQPQTAATSAPSVLEQALRRDRVVVIVAIIVIAAIAWAYTVYIAETGMGMGDEMGMSMAMADMRSWSAADFGLMFVMWAVMMVAMMAPSAAPMLLMFAALNRRRRERDAPYVPTGIFLAGYVIVWSVFAAAATGGNWGLHQASLLSSMMGASTSGYLGGALLLAAGAFQWSPLKTACLKQCRTPMGFLMTSWREGHLGALRMGLEHGVYCLGCCWALMLLLFALGIMNLVWIAALAAFVLAEKVAPMSEWVSRSTGVLLAGWGIWAIANAAM